MSASCHVTKTPQMTCPPDICQHVGNMSKMLGQHLTKNVVSTYQTTCCQRHFEDILSSEHLRHVDNMSPKTFWWHVIKISCQQYVIDDISMTCHQNFMSTICHRWHFDDMLSKCPWHTVDMTFHRHFEGMSVTTCCVVLIVVKHLVHWTTNENTKWIE